MAKSRGARRRRRIPHLLGAGGRGALRALVAGRALLAFDFDGTLAPLAERPQDARLPARTRRLLARVARLYPCVVISGRAHRDLLRHLRRLPLVAVAGCHGAEGADDGRTRAHGPSRVGRWSNALRRRLRRLRGVALEPKPHGVAVHYRAALDREAARGSILEAVATLEGVRLIPGRDVVEVVAADAPTKGDALAAIRRQLKPRATLYVGDDLTDEDAFASRGPGGLLPVRVGAEGRTSARFRLDAQSEVESLLDELLRLAPRGRPRAASPRRA
jgi:trehalose 6-phosphate phosphatase